MCSFSGGVGAFVEDGGRRGFDGGRPSAVRRLQFFSTAVRAQPGDYFLPHWRSVRALLDSKGDAQNGPHYHIQAEDCGR